MPAHRPRWKAIRTPAVLVGIAVALFTQAFAFIAPRLIGIAALYGAIAAVFAVLAWLSIVAQLLLIGLVWVRYREEGWPEPGRLGRADQSWLSPGASRSAGRSGPWPTVTVRS